MDTNVLLGVMQGCQETCLEKLLTTSKPMGARRSHTKPLLFKRTSTPVSWLDDWTAANAVFSSVP